jgi:transposase
VSEHRSPEMDGVAAALAVVRPSQKPEPLKSKLLSSGSILSYARYSTDEQKQSSIARQNERNDRYSTKTCGRKPDFHFKDEGFSGGTVEDRPGLLGALALVKQNRIKNFIVEDVDRLTRVVNDAMRLGEVFDAYDVRLHVSTLGRSITSTELVDAARHAQLDRERRTYLLNDGIDRLYEDGGSMLAGTFGFIATDQPGFPKLDENVTPGIVRMWQLLPSMSDHKTARTLTEEGYPSPSGGPWTGAQVTNLRKRICFAGYRLYRTTNQVRRRVLPVVEDDTLRDDRSDENWDVRLESTKKAKPRDQTEWVGEFNESFELVKLDVFRKVNEAKRDSFKGSGKKAAADSLPFPNPICDCPTRPDDQRYAKMNKENLGCNVRHRFGACPCKTGDSIKFDKLLPAVIDMILDYLAPVNREKCVENLRSLLTRESEAINSKRDAYSALQAKAESQLEKLLDKALELDGFSPARVKKRRVSLEDEVARYKSLIADNPPLDVDLIDFESPLLDIDSALELLKSGAALKNGSPAKAMVSDILAKLIKRVVLNRENVATGRVGISIDISLDAFLLAEHSCSEDLSLTSVLYREISLDWAYYRNSKKSRASLEELARAGSLKLTDAQWDLLSPHLPDMSVPHGKIRATMPTRQVADAVVFVGRTNASHLSLPKELGDPYLLKRTIGRFIFSGGYETMLRIMSEADPEWVKGLNPNILPSVGRSSDSKMPWALLRPGISAVECAADGRYRVTDQQYEIVKDLIDPRVLTPRGAPARPFTARQLLDGVMIKLRTRTSWTNMPSEFGKKNDLRGSATSLVSTGSWNRIVTALKEHFPDMLDGLDTNPLVRLYDNRKAEMQGEMNSRSAQRENLVAILNNITTITKDAADENKLATLRDPVSVALPNRRWLLPSLVIAAPEAIHRRKVLVPALIVRTTDNHFWNLDRAKTLSYQDCRGAPDILLLALDIGRIEYFRNAVGKWNSYVADRPTDNLTLQRLGVTCDLASIYRDVSVKWGV